MLSYIGEIKLFAGDYAPDGWEFCDGRLLSVKESGALFELIGTTYGGDGIDNFALPDLRGRVAVGEGASFPIGTAAGRENIRLSEAQLPAHGHIVYASGANDSKAEGSYWGSSANDFCYANATVGNSYAMNPESISVTGGTDAHENRIPILALTYIIAIEGIYPTRP